MPELRRRPVFWAETGFRLAGKKRFGNRDYGESRLVPIPERLARRTTLEEISLRLTAICFQKCNLENCVWRGRPDPFSGFFRKKGNRLEPD